MRQDALGIVKRGAAQGMAADAVVSELLRALPLASMEAFLVVSPGAAAARVAWG